jgi:hypothetical protein
MTYYDETVQMIQERKKDLAAAFEKECIRLLNSGAIDKEAHSRGTLFSVALSNISDNYTTYFGNRFNSREKREFNNLKHF